MKKRIFSLSMAILMLLTCVLSFASCMGGGGSGAGGEGGSGEVCQHTDEKDHNGKCDECKEKMTPAACVDTKDHNGKCDVCGKEGVVPPHTYSGVICTNPNCVDPIQAHQHVSNDGGNICSLCGGNVCDHVDNDFDGICDECGLETPREKCANDTCQDSNNDNKCDVCKNDVNCSHFDGDQNTRCDYCNAYVPKQEVDVTYPWGNAQQTLIMQLTKNTNDDELKAVAENYLEGALKYTDSVAELTRTRNSNAKLKTKITVEYLYYANTKDYGWGTSIDRIETELRQNTSTDIYALFIYDMVGASIKGCFANLLTSTASNRQNNYFEFNDADYDPRPESDRGYMYDYMESLTLAPGKKMYILSSDYFIDMVRAFFCVPVSIKLMEDMGAEIVKLDANGEERYKNGDRTGDGKFNIEDFYKLVTDGEWTYDRIAKFSSEVWTPAGAATAGAQLSDNVVGFAIDTGGLAASGLLYTTSVTIIEKTNNGDGTYSYNYPSDNQDFYAFADAAKKLFGETQGVLVVNKDSGFEQYGSEGHLAIRNRFAQNTILFGDIVLLGALEFDAYQDMKSDGGFGVVPVPVYKAGDRYLTQIHNMGSCGAISTKTQRFSQCTAFLNYQSTHSTQVLEEYYKVNVKRGLATNSEGTVQMLQYLRDNVRTSFDKAMEDAIAVNKPGAIRWHNVLSGASYQIDVRTQYQANYNSKQGELESLATKMAGLPD